MTTAADAITECVERFVQEILVLIEQAREEHRADALKVVAGMLAEAGRPAASQKAPVPAPRSGGSRRGGSSAKTPVAPTVPGAGSSERASGRGSRAAVRTGKAAPPAVVRRPETTAPTSSASSSASTAGTGEAASMTTGKPGERPRPAAPAPKEESSAPTEAAAPLSTPAPVKAPGPASTKAGSATALSTASPERAPGRRRRAAARTGANPEVRSQQPEVTEPKNDTSSVPPAPPTVPSTPAPANGTEMQKNEREAVVLAAVRALVRATASEVAAHSGQPNGSVSVALRALVARSQVARTETARGIEYSLISPGDIKPFKRMKKTSASSEPSAEGGAPRTTAADAFAARSSSAAVRVVEPPSPPPPVAPSTPAPKRRPQPNNPQLSLFDPPPPEPKG